MKWLKRDYGWWPALMFVMVLGTILLTIGYDAGLPLYESVDERHNLDEVYILRGLETSRLWKPGYPPGILYVNYATQLFVEMQTGDSAYNQPCLVIRYVRLTDIIVNLITALLIAFIGRKLGSHWAGILAALAWLVAQRVLAQTQFGFPQIYEGLLYLLALYTAILAVEKQRPLYALLSILAGLGAVLFKYPIFPVLGLAVGAALWNLRVDKGRWLRVLLAQFALIGLAALGLLTFGGVGSLASSGHAETNFFLEGGLGRLFDLTLVFRYFSEATGQIGLSAPVFMVVVLLGSVVIWTSEVTWKRIGWLGLVGLGLSHPLFMVTYVNKLQLDRNLLSSSSLLVLMASLSLLAIGKWLISHYGRSLVVKACIAVFVMVWLVPQFVYSWLWVNYRALPVTYGGMVEWVNQNLPEETLVVSDRRPFTREWACFTGLTTPPGQEDVMAQSIDEWLAQDVYYAQLSGTQIEEMNSTPEGRDYLAQMTLLQQFPPPGEETRWRTWRRGEDPRIAVYQLWQIDPDFPTEVTFGDQVRLVGYDLDDAGLTPGAALNLRFYWQPVQQPAADYNVFVHLVSADDPSTILAQHDGVPSRSSLRPTSTWHNLDEFFISRSFPLVIPDSLEPGSYILSMGLYDWNTGARLLTEDGRDTVEIPVTLAPQ